MHHRPALVRARDGCASAAALSLCLFSLASRIDVACPKLPARLPRFEHLLVVAYPVQRAAANDAAPAADGVVPRGCVFGHMWPLCGPVWPAEMVGDVGVD